MPASWVVDKERYQKLAWGKDRSVRLTTKV
jgi:hypothetical protein